MEQNSRHYYKSEYDEIADMMKSISLIRKPERFRMCFVNDIPNFALYNSDKYIMHSDKMPSSFWNQLQGLVLRAGNYIDLKEILDYFAAIIPCKPTIHTDRNSLKRDIDTYIGIITDKVAQGRFDILMDCIGIIAQCSDTLINDVNELLSEYNIGYYCKSDICLYQNEVCELFNWNKRDEYLFIDELNETKQSTKNECVQAYKEISRAMKSLGDATIDDRARKDSVRSCVSAMEALIKKYGNDTEIAQATKNLRSEGDWGPPEIVKDGHAIFNLMHKLYPDLRHGAVEESSMCLKRYPRCQVHMNKI